MMVVLYAVAVWTALMVALGCALGATIAAETGEFEKEYACAHGFIVSFMFWLMLLMLGALSQ